MSNTEDAVRNYLTALKDPNALRDDDAIADLESKIDSSDDQLERVKLRQQLIEAKAPQLARYEQDFVDKAKAWGDEHGVTIEAFKNEGVPTNVLRRAGFSVRGGRGRSKDSTGSPRSKTGTRTRVTSDEVRAAIPNGTFTVKQLQDKSGVSPAVARVGRHAD